MASANKQLTLVLSWTPTEMDRCLLPLVLLFAPTLTTGQFVSKDVELIDPITNQCFVTVKDDFSGFYPILFDSQGDFWPYEKLESEENSWQLAINDGQQMIVSCAPNYLRSFNNQKTVKFSCVDGKLTNELGVQKKWKDVSCEMRPVEEIIAPTTVDHCSAPSHSGVEFGYVNPVTQKTLILGQACYSPEKGHTEFVQMKLKSSKEAVEKSALKVEAENYFQRKQHPSGRYKIDMMKAWGDHMRTRADSSVAIMSKRFALPQSLHLSTLKKLGWNYAFSEEGHETWTELQDQVMKMVEKKKDVIVDYTAGSHGVMQVNNGEELYLGQEERFAVPKYLWMVVRDGVQGMAFVVFNKAEMTSAEEEKFQGVCTSKCGEVQWLGGEFKTTHKKYVLCCDVNDARANIPEMPLQTGITRAFLY